MIGLVWEGKGREGVQGNGKMDIWLMEFPIVKGQKKISIIRRNGPDIRLNGGRSELELQLDALGCTGVGEFLKDVLMS